MWPCPGFGQRTRCRTCKLVGSLPMNLKYSSSGCQEANRQLCGMEPMERAIMEFMERTGIVSPALFCLVHAMSEKSRLLGWPLPTPEDVRLDGLVAFRKKTDACSAHHRRRGATGSRRASAGAAANLKMLRPRSANTEVYNHLPHLDRWLCCGQKVSTYGVRAI